jgi:hypothetical protein
MRRILLVSAALVLAMATATTTAQAKPTDQFRFADYDSYVINDFCGDIAVRVVFSERGSGVGRLAGRGRQLRYTVTHHGQATYTNLASGRKFTFAWNYLDQDKRVTDNGDGTLSILGMSPGSERVKGPDGKLLDVKAGLFRWVVVLDHGGTPTDPIDDEFVSITFLSGPDVYTELCDDFRRLTG